MKQEKIETDADYNESRFETAQQVGPISRMLP